MLGFLIVVILLLLVSGTVWWHRQIYRENEELGTSAAQDLGNWIKQIVRQMFRR